MSQNSDYSVESLRNGIDSCYKNIKIFQEAIDKENETIKEYRYMIETIERKADIRQNIIVEVVEEE